MNARPGASLRRLGLLAVVTIVVVVVAGFVLTALGALEMPLSIALNGLHQGALGAAGDLLYRGVGPVPAIIGTIVLTSIILLVRRDLASTSTFAVTIAVTWLSVAAVKLLVGRPRPEAGLLSLPFHPAQTDASYPSGHAAFVTALVFALVMLCRTRRARVIAGAVGGILVATVVLLLAIDGVHYLSDALASVVWVLGVAPFVRAAWLQLVVARVPLLQRRIRLGSES